MSTCSGIAKEDNFIRLTSTRFKFQNFHCKCYFVTCIVFQNRGDFSNSLLEKHDEEENNVVLVFGFSLLGHLRG